MRICRLKVESFRCLADVGIPFSGITILLGRNGSITKGQRRKSRVVANLDSEVKLWQNADALLDGMDASRYNRVVLPLPEVNLRRVRDVAHPLNVVCARGANPEYPNEYCNKLERMHCDSLWEGEDEGGRLGFPSRASRPGRVKY